MAEPLCIIILNSSYTNGPYNRDFKLIKQLYSRNCVVFSPEKCTVKQEKNEGKHIKIAYLCMITEAKNNFDCTYTFGYICDIFRHSGLV